MFFPDLYDCIRRNKDKLNEYQKKKTLENAMKIVQLMERELKLKGA